MKNRTLNGYIAIYKPEHPTAYKGGNWDGYVYEHRYMMEQFLGRSLLSDETVHHLDCDKTNNNINNLIVVSRSFHIRIHNWIDAGCNIHKDYKKKTRQNNHYVELPTCIIEGCFNQCKNSDNKYCSVECRKKAKRSHLPEMKDVLKLLLSNNFTQVGKMYNVSDNAVRKWVKGWGFDPNTIRQELKTARSIGE